MANRSTLNERLNRLELRAAHIAATLMTKSQRDELVRRFLAEGDISSLLARETDPHRRAVIEATARADV